MFCFGPDARIRGANRRLLCGRDPAGPPLTRDPEVGPQLAGIIKPGRSVVLGERELLVYVRDRAADELERDPVWPAALPRLHDR